MEILQRAATAAYSDPSKLTNDPPHSAISINMFGEKNKGLINAMGPKNFANLMNNLAS